MVMSISVLSNIVASSQMCEWSTWNVTDVTKILDLKSHMKLVAT